MTLTLDDLAAGKYDLDDSAKAMIKTYTESREQLSKAAKACYDETRTKEMSLTLVQLATAIEQGKTIELKVGGESIYWDKAIGGLAAFISWYRDPQCVRIKPEPREIWVSPDGKIHKEPVVGLSRSVGGFIEYTHFKEVL